MLKKKIFLAFCSVLITHWANGQQLEKNTQIVGLTGGYFNVKQANFSSAFFILTASDLVMLSHYFALGGNLSLLVEGGSTNVTIGPAARIYATDSSPVRPFLTGNVGYSTQNSGLGYGIGVGISSFLNNSVALDITANYGNSVNIGGLNTNTGSDGHIFSIQFGFQVFLPKK